MKCDGWYGDFFYIPVELMHTISLSLSDEELGRLFKGIISYARTKEDPVFFGDEWFFWELTKAGIEHPNGLGRNNKGENHWNWKGGITPENQIGRASSGYTKWRMAVFQRDDFTCACCGTVGGRLNAHHIVPWAEDKSLRFDINNGITLCEKCHKELHRSLRNGEKKDD